MKMPNRRKVEGQDVALIVMGVIFAAAAYLLGTSYLFQIGADGSFLMYRAANELVSSKSPDLFCCPHGPTDFRRRLSADSEIRIGTRYRSTR
jgi:hypothetical protein